MNSGSDGGNPRLTARNASSPLVSVVTPAYNEENFLAECIESVLAQTYPNWDYTIVNNCSTDATLAIAQKFADQDPRIRVVSNTALIPAVANFNVAMRQISADSKYAKIILADDWIFPECLERMVAVMEEHSSVGIVGSYALANPWVVFAGLPYPSDFVSGREACRRRLLGGPYVFGATSSVLFRSDLVRSHEPFYRESNMQSDSEACFELLKDCDFGFVHQVLLFLRKRSGSMLQASQELNSAAAGMLHEAVVYGPWYLTPQENAECVAATVSKYYDFLGASLLRGRRGEFWDYHKRKMKEEGVEFSRTRLLGAVARRALGRFVRLPGASEERQWGL